MTGCKESLRGKLQSNTGASLAVALLFFLVCAVVGTMLLVSASTASGRMKSAIIYDQNKYAVESAAKVLKEDLSKERVILERTKTSVYDLAPTKLGEGNLKENLTPSDSYSSRILSSNGSAIDAKNYTVLQQLTGDCRGLNGSNVDQALYFQDDIQNSKIENDKSQSFTMTVDGFTDPSIPKGTKVQAKVTITMHADMSLDIQVRSVDNAKAEYVVYMTASPTVVLTSTSSNSSGQIDNEKPQNSIEATLIETKTTSISWSDVRITKDK
jgi:hypothetical protein